MGDQNFTIANRLNASIFLPSNVAQIYRMGAINMVIIGIGLVLNFIIILGTHYKKSLRRNTYYFIANLAGCDMMLGISLAIHLILNLWTPPNLMSSQVKLIICKIFIVFPVFWSYTASVQTLIIISIERYRAIYRPTKKLNRRKAIWLCVLAWAVSFVISFPFLITTSLVGHQCVAFASHTIWVTVINMILVMFQFVIPAIVMMFSYSAILRQLRAKNLNIGHESLTSERLKRKTVYMLILTTLIFLICALPWALSLLFEAFTGSFSFQILFDDSKPIMQLIVRVSRVAFPLSTVYNSIIYCCFNRKIRELFFPCYYWHLKNIVHTELNSHVRSDSNAPDRSIRLGTHNNFKPTVSEMTVIAT